MGYTQYNYGSNFLLSMPRILIKGKFRANAAYCCKNSLYKLEDNIRWP